jgi:hypothetical protein
MTGNRSGRAAGRGDGIGVDRDGFLTRGQIANARGAVAADTAVRGGDHGLEEARGGGRVKRVATAPEHRGSHLGGLAVGRDTDRFAVRQLVDLSGARLHRPSLVRA